MNTDWDSQRTYRQLVILISFSDCDFKSEHARESYDSLFNEPGYNKRSGPGCVADYFREQSGGLFNLQFDVTGPVKVEAKACPYENPTESTRNYGRDQFVEATKQIIKDNPDMDFSAYDWNGDGYVNQVVYVYAGTGGNQGQKSYGHIWPNTSSFTSITTPGGVKISNYTASSETWSNGLSTGIGTICHEFSHSLGLPDIYPTSSSAGFSVADEWDLMDGGNFTNLGWCPPNYTPVEKMLLGWLTPIELEEPTSVRELKSVADGGTTYRIMHSENEWYLLENRQQRGWDFGLPGKGLVVYHVVYDNSAWRGNTVNNDKSRRRFELVHADNLDYDDWDEIIEGSSPYAETAYLHNKHLSTSPYPWTTDSTTFVNNELTDNSVPPAKMSSPNEEGNLMLSKSITNITMSEDGLVSFDFMQVQVGMEDLSLQAAGCRPQMYDLSGRSVNAPARGQLCIVREADGRIRKYLNRR